MQLTYNQKQSILTQGYVHIPGVVPQVMIDKALHAINHSIGEGMDAADMRTMRSRSYCTELQKDPVILDLLYKTPAWTLAESAIGQDKIKPTSSGQIALRFPSLVDPPPEPHPHLDGMHSPHNGVPKGEIRNFTMLVGIALSNVSAPYSGNFTVWPRTHTLFQDYFREHGPESLLKGMPDVELPEPHQLLAKAGDVMLVHYEVAHSAAIYPAYCLSQPLRTHRISPFYSWLAQVIPVSDFRKRQISVIERLSKGPLYLA
ncbi:MAG: hypothetical protein AAF702_19410 [Chloroflexota bacterium]